MRALVLSLLLAAPATAQELNFDIAETLRCLEAVHATENPDEQQCFGTSALQCMEATPGGFSTVGMVGCYAAELDWWDGQLNIAYQELMTHSREMDGLNGASAPSQAEALRDMQRAWITFRDAKCAYVRSQWGGGTGGGPADISCQMYETAQQARFLTLSLPN